MHDGTFSEIMQESKHGYSSKHLARNVQNNAIEWDELKVAWSELVHLATRYGLPDHELLLLRDIITICGAKSLSLRFIGSDEDELGAVYVSSSQTLLWQCIREFLIYREQETKVIFGSATMFEPYPDFFSDLAGTELEHKTYPDINNATKKMTLIPDKWRLGSRNFKERLPEIVERIKEIAGIEKKPILVLIMSKKRAAVLEKLLHGVSSVTVDYFGSDQTIGVKRTQRLCIVVGLGYLPANTYDNMAKDWLQSQQLRELAVDAASWQAICRIKDPAGERESKVYFIGVRLDRILQLATWGTERTLTVVNVGEIDVPGDGTVKIPLFKVKVKEALDLPNIRAEIKNAARSDQRSVKDFISNIENNCIFSENHYISPNNIYRENVAKLGIYNNPMNIDEINATAECLMELFANRVDCYAQQKPGWTKVLRPLSLDVLKRHVAGHETIGTYQIGLDDTVKWVCYDCDAHEGDKSVTEEMLLTNRDKINRLTAICHKYDIPFLLEASGSVGSYHLWIPLASTKTYNAFKFSRQIAAEAKVDCEIWPKQRRMGKDGKYGNLVKVPVCLHLKSLTRSFFVDPDTLRPLEGCISHPGLVHLLEIPEPKEVVRDSTTGRLLKAHPGCMQSPADNIGTAPELDYCMRELLLSMTHLEGSAGHHMRVAIAIKARSIGLDAEATTALFKDQPDYDHDFSLAKVEEIWQHSYNNWSCKTLLDKCRPLVNTYCRTCPHKPRSLLGELMVNA